MAVLSSHLLNGVDGTHAGNVAVSLIKIEADGTRLTVFQGVSDEGGRFKCEVSAASDAIYEMVITSGTYSPTLEYSIALARVPKKATGDCEVDIRGKRKTAMLCRPPFVRNGKIMHA